jgi:hypothetical protein
MNQGAVFGPTARWDVVSDGRLAVVEGVDYAIRLVDPESARETSISRPIRPRAVTDADRERERTRVRRLHEEPGAVATMSGGGGARPITPQQIREIVAAIEFAAVIPVVRDLRVDAGDRLWIQRYGETYEDDGPIDIFRTDGEYVGTLPAMPMPDAFGPMGLVAWMERGADIEVERVVVRRLPESLR